MKLAVVLLAGMMLWAGSAWAIEQPDILEVVELTGEIGDGAVTRMQQLVESVEANPKVRAVLLVVDSPGGGAISSANLYEELGRLKVPVVGWCSNVCASGAIYALMAPSVKYIAVRNEAISGSVGVIANVARYHRLLDWAKIDVETYRSGTLKDAGNPTRATEDAERAYIQSIIDELAARFYRVVEKGRPGIKDWASIRSARIYIGDQAVDIGLADAVLSRAQAITKAKDLSGSKLIYTREELKKMSKAAEGPGNGSWRYEAPMGPYGDLPWLVEQLKEIRAGSSVRFEYRMPWRF